MSENTNNQLATVKEEYEIIKNPQTNKFERKPIYPSFSSVVAETREQKLYMMKLLDSEDIAIPAGEHINKAFEIQDVIFSPYNKVDEETGELEHGILVYLITPELNDQKEPIVYVTSSKSTYYTMKRYFQLFGTPHYNEDERPKAKFVKKQGQQYKYTDLQIIG